MSKRSINRRYLTKTEKREAEENLFIIDRPFRSECRGGSRPCPLVGCRYNMYLNVTETGTIQFTHPGRAPEDVPEDESCSLDVADNGPQTLEDIGRIFGLTRERIRQIEYRALRKSRLPADQLFKIRLGTKSRHKQVEE